MKLSDLTGTHPAAEAQPGLPDVVYENLEAGALAGRRDPIQANPDGLVLDGKHRRRIALEHGLLDWPVEVVETDNEEAWVLRQAMSRRSLSKMERVFLAAERTLNSKKGKRAKQDGQDGQDSFIPQYCGIKPELTTEIACRLLDVKPRMVEAAKVILRDAQRIQLKAEIIAGKTALQETAARLTAERKRTEARRQDLTELETRITDTGNALNQAHQVWKTAREGLPEKAAVVEAEEYLKAVKDRFDGEISELDDRYRREKKAVDDWHRREAEAVKGRHRRETDTARNLITSRGEAYEEAVGRMPETAALNQAQEEHDQAREDYDLKCEMIRSEGGQPGR